jgi:hypothetical protein
VLFSELEGLEVAGWKVEKEAGLFPRPERREGR